MIEPYYQESGITIYNADCRDILPQLGPVDLVLTDPPYSSGARNDANRQVRGSMMRGLEDVEWFSHDSMTTWGFQWFMRSTLRELRSLLQEGSHIYWFTDWRMTPTVYGMLEAYGFRVNHCLVWAKTHFGMGTYWRNQHENIVFASVGQPSPMIDRGMGSVITAENVFHSTRFHPTEKPTELINAAVPGDTVLDPFMGSGTTLVAAKQLGRKAIGIEIEKKYCDIAIERLRQEVIPLPMPEPTDSENQAVLL
jgi:site-specific DNA-methyltransferase (adenine-specific)